MPSTRRHRLLRASAAALGRVDWSTAVSPKYADASDGEVAASVEGCVSGAATVSLADRPTRSD